MRDELNTFENYLKEKNLKKTDQRLGVLRVFLKQERHISAEDLYKLVKRESPGVGFATVYRTLKHIAASGLARELEFGDGRVRFEHLFGHEHHDHLICVKCGRFSEVLEKGIEKLQDRLAARNNFRPLRHRLEIYGICKNCQR